MILYIPVKHLHLYPQHKYYLEVALHHRQINPKNYALLSGMRKRNFQHLHKVQKIYIQQYSYYHFLRRKQVLPSLHRSIPNLCNNFLFVFSLTSPCPFLCIYSWNARNPIMILFPYPVPFQLHFTNLITLNIREIVLYQISNWNEIFLQII